MDSHSRIRTLDPISYRNRYSGRIENETIYGQSWLHWAYGTAFGRWSLRTFAVRPWFSRWYGWRMSRTASRSRIGPFVREFAVNAAEFAESPDSFRTFNEFFVRRLRPDARPIHSDPRAVVFPADGRHLGFANLAAADSFYIKGQHFDLREFLADESLLKRFTGGAAVFSRLSPVDCHRFHFPIAGVPSAPRLVNGWLWSVNPVALRQNLAFLWQNRRWHCEIDAGPLGQVLMTEIGATNVGSVAYTYTPGVAVSKGAEKGCFRFGGSAVLTLFEPNRVRLCEDLLAVTTETTETTELYAHLGDVMAWRNE